MRSAVSLSLFLALIVRVHSEVVLTQPKTETARPGGSITIPCKTSGFTLSISWMSLVRQVPGQELEWLLLYYSQSNTKYFAPGIESRFTPSKDNSNNLFIVTARNLGIEDTAVYYCARYNHRFLEYWGRGTMVTVTSAAPSAPSPFILFTCEDHGSSGSFTYGCLVLGDSSVGTSVSWKKDDKQLTTGVKDYPAVFNRLGTYTRSSEITITETWGGNIFCVVQHDQKEYQLRLPEPVVQHPTVTITITPLEEIKRSRKVIAVCLVNDFIPAKFTENWLKNGKPLDSGIVTSPALQVNGNFSATSQLTFPAAEWFGGVVYTCQVNHEKYLINQNISRPLDDSSCGELKITILPPPAEQELMEMTVTLTCRVSDAPYGITVSWNRKKEHLESEIQPTEHKDIVESKVIISTRDWLSGDYFECVVTHDDMPAPKAERINWKKGQHLLPPSVSVLLPPTEEISAHKTITLTCFVRGFSPRRVFVTWTVDDKRVDGSKYRNTEVEAENGNDTFFTYSLLSVGAEQWASGASFSCLVGHEALPMKTIVRTVNKSSDCADNVPLEDYEEDRDNIWTTAPTFIILFFLSISYGATVTLAKVK